MMRETSSGTSIIRPRIGAPRPEPASATGATYLSLRVSRMLSMAETIFPGHQDDLDKRSIQDLLGATWSGTRRTPGRVAGDCAGRVRRGGRTLRLRQVHPASPHSRPSEAEHRTGERQRPA